MPESTSKPPELIQAQIAAYAGERLVHHSDIKHIFSNLGSIALENPDNVVRVLGSAEYVNEGDDRVRLSEGTQRVVVSREQYVNYLRDVEGVKHEGISGRVELLRNFATFSPQIEKLKADITQHDGDKSHREAYQARKNHPQYLASGLNSQTFVIEREGKEYVVREAGHGGVDSHVKAALIGNSIPHLEHIVAASYETGVTVAERMAGKEMRQVAAEDLEQVTEGQLETFIDTLLAANRSGISIDPEPSNFFYDTKDGFGVIDYHMPSEFAPAQDGATVISWVETIIGNAGTYGFNPETVEDYAYMKSQTVASRAVLEKFKEVCERRFTGDALEKIMKRLDDRIESQAGSINNYSDPEWVSHQVESTRVYKEQLAQTEANRLSNQKVPVIPLGWDIVD